MGECDPVNFSSLLCLRPSRYGHCTTNQDYEIAASHSITLSDSRQQSLWYCHTHRRGGLEVDHQLELGWLFDGNVGDLDAPQELNELTAVRLSKDLNEARSVRCKAAFFRHFGRLIDGREAQYRNPFHYKLTVPPKHR
jgi:hypothetical protein